MFKEPELNYLPTVPEKADYGIGLIGAGGIAEIGHLPAFIKAGYRIVAVADVSEERRQYVRQLLGLEAVYADHRELLEDPEVQIVDITIPQSSADKIPVVHDTIEAGKHLLVEKPLTMDYGEAKTIVERARSAGVKLAICHQYRWMPVWRAIKNMVDQHYLGQLYFIQMDERRAYDLLETNFAQQPHMLLFMELIHYIDQIRWWVGAEPSAVFASLLRRPDQQVRGEMLGTLVMDFGQDLQAAITANVAAYPQAQYHKIALEGTGGLIQASFDDLWQAGELAFSPVRAEALWYKPRLEGVGFPDGFIGLMGDLMEAITCDRAPAVSGEDNLKTMQVVFAAYRSDEDGRTVAPSEIDPNGT